jgi:hypothetical protein
MSVRKSPTDNDSKYFYQFQDLREKGTAYFETKFHWEADSFRRCCHRKFDNIRTAIFPQNDGFWIAKVTTQTKVTRSELRQI